jgi:hypothetical protein
MITMAARVSAAILAFIVVFALLAGAGAALVQMLEKAGAPLWIAIIFSAGTGAVAAIYGLKAAVLCWSAWP